MKTKNLKSIKWPSFWSGGPSGQKKKPPSAEEIQAWLIHELSDLLGIKPQDIDIHEPFTSYGLDSVMAVSMMVNLEERVGRELSDTMVWDYPSIEALSRYLAEISRERMEGDPSRQPE